jgi:hypothetical protein
VNIGGWFLSDSKDSLRKFRIPAGTSIPGNGYTVFYEIQFNNDTNGVPFGLSSSDGDQVYLSAANANGTLTGYRASARFGAAENGVSFGRYQNTAGEVDYRAHEPAQFRSECAGFGGAIPHRHGREQRLSERRPHCD